ncbi:MAG: hypothetical protein ACYC69_13150 [Thermodesulfovibrionales bacterium]
MRYETKFLGRWRLVHTEGTDDTGLGTEVEFHPDGKLTYTINLSEKQQLIFLTWRLEDGFLVSNQPSHPAEVRSKIISLGPDELVLEYAGEKTRLVRVGAGSS